MNKGEKYDQMIKNPQGDELGFFENYFENMKVVQERIRDLNPNVIFDIGCGTGNLTGPLSNELKVVGIDKSDEMLFQAKIKYPRLETINEDIETWISSVNISNDNLIISSFVLHAIKDKDDLKKWFLKAIKSGNAVIIVDYFFKDDNAILDCLGKLKKENKNELAKIVESKYYIKTDEIRAWCVKHNVKLEIKMLTNWIGMIEMTRLY